MPSNQPRDDRKSSIHGREATIEEDYYWRPGAVSNRDTWLVELGHRTEYIQVGQ